MDNQNLEKMKYEAAKEHVARIRKFAVSLVVFIIFFLLFNGSNIIRFNDFNLDFVNVSPIFWIWGIILAIKAVKLFVFDYDWERKTIEKYLKNH